MHIALPLEIFKREFESKIWLTSNLISDGHTVTLGQDTIINQNLDHIDPDFYLGLSAVNRQSRKDRFEALKDSGVVIGVLDTEGGAFGSREGFRNRINPSILNHVDHYFAWGPQSADIAQEVVRKHEIETEIHIPGNPRFDLLSPEHFSKYQNESKIIGEKYGDFVLINTNFSINHRNIDLRDRGAIREGAERTKRLKQQSYILSKFLSLVCYIRNKSKWNIVVRPHPIECDSIYKTLFRPYDNVYVNASGDVKPWLLAAGAVIHNSCTTGLESSIMGKPVISYLDDFRDTKITNQFSMSANSPDEVLELLHDIDNQGVRSKQNTIGKYIGNIDKQSAPEITDVVNECDNSPAAPIDIEHTLYDYAGYVTYNISPRLYRWLRNTDITPNRWSYTTFKFGILTTDDVRQEMSKHGYEPKIERYRSLDNVVRIEMD